MQSWQSQKKNSARNSDGVVLCAQHRNKNMDEQIEIKIPDLPENFRKEIHDQTRLSSVTMLMANNDQTEEVVPCSGTLCHIKSAFGILTARHVWEEAKKYKILLVMTVRGPFRIQTSDIVPIVPSVNSTFSDTSAKIPDIAFLQINAECKSKIEALGKVFLSIDKRSKKLELFLGRTDGYWSIFGNPQELIKIPSRTVTSFIYGTGVSERVEIQGWDYLTVRLDILENSQIPKKFGGVSGGGLWRTFWSTDENKERFVVSNIFEDIMLMGVCFYQIYGDNSRLIAHGPVSIYKNLIGLL